jgi:hypothetical protein
LHEAKASQLYFLSNPATFKLSEDQTKALTDILTAAPLFNGELHKEVHIDSAAEKRFAEVLDDKKIAYIRFSQTPSDFSKVLREMKAKRPDFLVFSDKPYFIEVKLWPLKYYKREIDIFLEEIEKLKQLEFATGVTVFMAFPIDILGLQWRAVRPGRAWATGQRRTEKGDVIISISVEELEKQELPFL